MNSTVTHRPELHRFELTTPGGTAIVEYSDTGDSWSIHHTYVPPALRGKGLGADVVRAALDAARSQGKKVRPDCSYVAAYIARHGEYGDLVANSR